MALIFMVYIYYNIISFLIITERDILKYFIVRKNKFMFYIAKLSTDTLNLSTRLFIKFNNMVSVKFA